MNEVFKEYSKGYSHYLSILWPLEPFKKSIYWFGCAGSLVWHEGSSIFVVVSRFFSCSLKTLSCGIWDLVPWPGIKPRPPTLQGWNLSHWTTRESPWLTHFNSHNNSMRQTLLASPLYQRRNRDPARWTNSSTGKCWDTFPKQAERHGAANANRQPLWPPQLWSLKSFRTVFLRLLSMNDVHFAHEVANTLALHPRTQSV